MPDRPLPDEFALIARFFRPLAAGEPGAFALTDDAAVIAPPPGCELVVTTDMVVAGVHFLPDDPARLVAKKVLRVNLSDLAAMGARPRAYLLAAAFPRTLGEDWLAEFAGGLGEDQAAFGVTLIGGDTTATDGPLTLSVTALGEVRAGSAIRRAGARAGDSIYLSGTLGDGALGLRVLTGGLAGLPEAARAALVGRYRVPEPRVSLGVRLVGLAHAAIDVSDGLMADLGHIAEASGVAAEVEASTLPFSSAARAALEADPALLAAALAGGDDYELLFTVDPGSDSSVRELSDALGLALTRIGRVRAGAGVRVLDRSGAPIALE
ncbi:MAG: thiamine-phosphate kinase, partial [Alphaproteobacteria bacterium]